MPKSKEQQVQFFKDCLLPRINITPELIDVYSLVDSELTTSENWRENIKPRAEKITDRIFLTKKELEAHIETYEAKREAEYN
jgi:hypothetical protein